MNQTLPKILLGTYTYRGKHYAFPKFIETVQEIVQEYSGEADVLIVDNSIGKEYASLIRLHCDNLDIKDKITVTHMCKSGKTTREKQRRSQDILWEQTLLGNYDYLYLIESDVYPPKNSIEKLLRHKKKVVSGVYSLQNEEVGPILCLMGYNRTPEGEYYWEPEANLKKLQKMCGEHPLKVYACGLGCIMIHKEVLKTIRPEYSTYKLKKFITAIDEGVNRVKTYYEMDSTIADYLTGLTGRLKKNICKSYKKKIHPDGAFHRNCEIYNVNRYVDTSIVCEHNRSNWSECKVPR